MPLYVYQVIDPEGAEGEVFEVLQDMSEPPLTQHPETGKPVHRLLGTPSACRYGPATSATNGSIAWGSPSINGTAKAPTRKPPAPAPASSPRKSDQDPCGGKFSTCQATLWRQVFNLPSDFVAASFQLAKRLCGGKFSTCHLYILAATNTPASGNFPSFPAFPRRTVGFEPEQKMNYAWNRGRADLCGTMTPTIPCGVCLPV